jgi:hypothetical protein
LRGLSVVAATKARNSYWRTLIEDWAVPPGVSPRIGASLQRERQSNAAPLPVWEMDWQDCPVAFRLRGLARRVVSVKVPLVFPPGDSESVILGRGAWRTRCAYGGSQWPRMPIMKGEKLTFP